MGCTSCGSSHDEIEEVDRFRQGDDWTIEWTRTAGTATYDDSTLVVQLRIGPAKTDTLIASSVRVTGTPSIPIDLTGTDLTTGPLKIKWSIPSNLNTGIAPGFYWLEIQCEVNGILKTIQRRRIEMLSQVAVGP